MSLIELIQKSEIQFWDFIIPLMEAEDSPLSKFIDFGYSIYQHYTRMNYIIKFVFWAGTGLIFGLVIGLKFS